MYSEPGQGTTFKVYLPRVDESPAPAAAPPMAVGPGGGETVLLVEDDAAIRRTTAMALGAEGYAVVEASDADEALRRFAADRPDLVILDVMLPVMDGWTVLAKLRQRKTTPVIMLTARDEVQDRIKGLDCGADDYLAKPFAMEELMARIRAAMRRTGGNPSPRLEFGDITMDTSSRLFYLRGVAVELTAREYAVMKALVDRGGRVVTREFLCDRILDEHSEAMSNMIEVYIYKLRSKFGKARILTKRGVGYSFDPNAS